MALREVRQEYQRVAKATTEGWLKTEMTEINTKCGGARLPGEDGEDEVQVR